MGTNGHPDDRFDQYGGQVPMPIGSAGGPPTEVIYSARPQARVATSGQQSQGNQVPAILAAVRRRWMWILLLGVLLGGAAGTAAWTFVPTLYTAFGELRIDLVRGDAPWNRGTYRLDPNSFRQSVMQRIKDPFVITKALRDSKVAECPTLRAQQFQDIWLQKELEVRSNGTENVRLSLAGNRPEDLAAIVNAVLQAFVTNEEEFYFNDRRQRLADITKVQDKESARRAVLRTELNGINSRIQTSSQSENQLKMQLQNEVFVQLRKEFGQVRLQIIEKNAQLASLKGDDPKDVVKNLQIPNEIVDAELGRDPAYQELITAVTRQAASVQQFQKRTRPEHSGRRDAEVKLAALEKELGAVRELQLPIVREKILEAVSARRGGPSTAEQLQAELARLSVYEAQYRQQLEENKAQIESTGSLMLEQQEKLRELVDVETRVKALDDEIWRRQLELDNDKPPVSRYMDAVVPKAPDEGKRIKMSLLASMAGFGLAAALIVWLEMLNRRINSTSDIEQQLHLRVVGSLPLLPRTFANKSTMTNDSKSAFWNTVLTESIDSVRTMLLRLAKMDGLKTVMIASATGGEGKTTLSCHLATSIARGGRSVLLIDGDIRQPSVNQVFGFTNQTGLCEVLKGEASLADAIVETSQAGLSILPAGQLDSLTLQRLALDQFGPLLQEAGRDYDFVIIDSAPLLPVTDSQMLAPHVDGVIFSVRRDVSRLTKVGAAIQRLVMLGAPVIGVVTIGFDSAEHSYYSYGQRSYGYYRRRLPAGELEHSEA